MAMAELCVDGGDLPLAQQRPAPHGPPQRRAPPRLPYVVHRDKTCPLLIRVFTKVKEVAPEARRRDARFSFAFVYPDRQGQNIFRNVGITNAKRSRRGGDDHHHTLSDLGFQVGDFLDVAML